MTEQFIITKEWIDINKTVNGGYTRLQAQALGLTWPLTKGWKRNIVGATITLEQKVTVEFFKSAKPNKKQVKSVMTIDSCIAYLMKNVEAINEKQASYIKLIANVYLK